MIIAFGHPVFSGVIFQEHKNSVIGYTKITLSSLFPPFVLGSMVLAVLTRLIGRINFVIKSSRIITERCGEYTAIAVRNPKSWRDY